MRIPVLGLAVVTLLAAFAPGLPAVSDTPVQLAVPGHANQFPAIAARGAVVVVAWGATRDGAADVYAAVSRDSGRTFGAPVRVNATPGTARLAGEITPRVALAAGTAGVPEIVIAWNGKASGTGIWLARSRDGGRTFTGETALHPDGAAGDRGWHALALDDAGVPHTVWLDHAGLATRRQGPDAPALDGPAMAQLSTLTYARAGAAPSAARAVAPGVCYCCKTALVSAPGQRLFAAWRHVYPGNIRDIAFAMSTDGGRSFTAPTRVSDDNWHLAGCPDDGPAMAVDAAGAVHVVWPTVVNGPEPQGAIFHARTRDGRQFTSRTRVETFGGPKPEHPTVAVARDGRLVVAWDEILGGVRRAGVRALTVDARGGVSAGPAVRLGADAPDAYPVLAEAADGMVAAWTRGTPGAAVIAVQRVAP